MEKNPPSAVVWETLRTSSSGQKVAHETRARDAVPPSRSPAPEKTVPGIIGDGYGRTEKAKWESFYLELAGKLDRLILTCVFSAKKRSF